MDVIFFENQLFYPRGGFQGESKITSEYQPREILKPAQLISTPAFAEPEPGPKIQFVTDLAQELGAEPEFESTSLPVAEIENEDNAPEDKELQVYSRKKKT